ncbi:sensor histidine kinase [Ornithinimicrobium panacihumi]|uniref:sensor histidine kinase n=1 Tax=Ornithinimicrobium panacihumi TaxID=2008449 RepID=UPI003F8CB670
MNAGPAPRRASGPDADPAPRVLLARPLLLALLPLLVGLVAALLWQLAGESRRYYLTGGMQWLPLILGALLSGALLLWSAATLRARRQGRDDLANALADRAAHQRRLLSRLDHELKNPIQGIRAALADEPSEQQLTSIDVQSRRLTRLLSDLRKVGEVEHTPLELGQVDPTALVEEAVDALRELPGSADRQIVLSLPRAPRPLPTVTGDDDLLFLAVSNLLANAVKYSSPGDTVEVRGRAEEGWLVLEIADTGAGIPADELDTVWEELGRGREALSTSVEGSGLGLPLVRAIARRHGGRATLESWHGEGSTVTLRLPLAGPPATG